MLRYVSHLLFFTHFLSGVYAQTAAYRNFTHKDGLPSSETYCVIQDSKGFIWLSTDRGVVRYDGIDFRTFTSSDGLPDNTVFEIFEDQKERIWMNTYSTRTGYIRNDSAFAYRYNSVIKSLLPSQLLHGLYIGEDGQVWFLKEGLTGNTVLSRIDTSGNLHVVNPENKRLIYITGKGKCFISGPLDSGLREILHLETGVRLGSVFYDVKNMREVFASPPDSSGSFFLCSNQKVWRISKQGTSFLFDYQNEVLSIYVDKELNILLGFRHHGLRLYSSSSNYTESRWLIRSISPSSIFRDREGGVWVSSLEKGLFYLFPFLPVWYSEIDGLSTAKIKRIVVNDNQHFLLLANDELVMLSGKYSYSLDRYQQSSGVIDLVIKPGFALYTTGYGSDLSKGLPNVKQTNLGFGKKISLGHNALWVVANSEILKFGYDGKQQQSISFARYPRLTCALEIGSGSLLVGTLDGLYLRNDQGIYFQGKRDPRLTGRISSIIRLDENHLMLTTLGNGIIILRERDLKPIIHYTVNKGLPSMMCNTAFVENDGTVWVATNRGICRIKRILEPEVSAIKTLDLDDGLISNEVNDILIIKDEIWLATLHGLSILSKKVADDRELTVPLYITKVSVNDGWINPGIPGAFSPNQNNIRISFTGLLFSHPKKLTYAYRLKGSDTSWYRGKDHFVIYNSLSAGNYVFEVRVIKPDGTLSPGIVRYPFRIHPEFYETIWFSVCVILLFFGLLWVAFRYRIDFVRRQEQMKNELSQFHDRALRNQMNPHFVYNALNSIQNYILRKDTLHSASLLAKFSQLMRLTFNNTSQDQISLADDLSALNLYVELEKIRFENPFRFSVVVDPELNPEKVFVPPLLIQPFVENSIAHGISTRTNGEINVIIKPVHNRLYICISDNGVGRKESGRIKEKKRKYAGPVFIPDNLRPSSGVKTTATRINRLWQKNADHSAFNIIDLYDGENNPSGTKVEFYIPLYHDQNHNY